MSLKVGDGGEPLSKKQKCGQKQTAPATSAATDVPMMENDATARSKLKDAGFDPDASVDDAAVVQFTPSLKWGVTPMIYFCRRGDMPMCRYLRSKGASTTRMGKHEWPFPMLTAVLSKINSLEMCKWIYKNGAQSDVRREYRTGHTPLSVAAANNKDELVRWLILHGALCADDSSDIVEVERINRYNRPALKRLAKWATTATQPIRNPSVVTFLCGALPPKSNDDTEGACILQYLSGQPGIRKRIAELAGQYTKREVSILRQVRDELPPFLAENR